MRNHLGILFCLITASVFAQIDTKKQPLKFELKLPSTTGTNSNSFDSSLPSLDYKSPLENNDNTILKRYSILNKKEEAKSVFDTSNDFKNPGDEVKDKLNGEINRDGNWEDVFFGKFVVRTPSIIIKMRDYMDPDGDRVKILLNAETMYSNELLEGHYNTYIINLREGDNLVAIMALNQGLAGPNTANFAIYDANNNLITANDWNLKTGVSAKFTIEYIKPMIEK